MSGHASWRRTAAAGLLVCMSGACGDRATTPLSPPAAELLEELMAEPHRLPAGVESDGEVVMVLLGLDERGRVVVDGAPVPVSPSELRLPRAMTQRRTTAPGDWAMVREATAQTIRYWAPMDTEALVRANVPDAERKGHSTRLRRVPVMYTSVRVPFYPHAELEIVRSVGTGAGTFRFGALPGDPMLQVR